MAAGDSPDPRVARLQALVRIPTLSYRDPAALDPEPFERLLAALREHYPRVHALEVIRVDSHGLLIHWPGAAATHPIVLMAHLDVVPAVGEWRFPPYDAVVADGAVWGRGTLDDKGSVAAICEAVEALLAEGVTPAQEVWLSFGCNEEVSGRGAAAAVEELRRRGVTPWLVLDEGGAVAHDSFPGVSTPLAVIGVSEKGSTELSMSVTGDGGHSSVPTRNGPTARLARAIIRLDGLRMPVHLPWPTLELFRRLAPHLPAPVRPLLRNAGPLTPVLSRLLALAGDEAAAMIRTTLAVTTLEGSPALNVIATTARAGVNARVMVGDSVEEVVEAMRRAIDDDAVTIKVVDAVEPSPLSPLGDAFELIETTIAAVFPDAVPTPYVMMAATDSRFFTAICPHVYRFAPFRMTRAQRSSIHAADEHLRIEDYLLGIDWYRRLIESGLRPDRIGPPC